MGVNAAAVQRLYVAYFNRPADPVGLAYWESQLSATVPATQAQLTALAAGFSGSAEYASLYAGQSNESIVNSLYNNLFGRDAEPVGLVHWAGQLAAGTQTFAQIALQLTFSAQGTDATAIANKLSAATAFTKELDTTAKIVGYSGDAAAASARTWLATVTDDAATLTAAVAPAALDAAVAEAAAMGTGTAGQTFMLTTDAEQITGTAGNDTFNGSNTTLVLDVLDGAGGTDTLNYSDVTGGKDINSLGLSLTSVETINVRSVGAATATTTGFTGVETLNALAGTSAALTAGGATNVNVSGLTDAIAINGGKNITVTDATAGKNIDIGATTVNAGTITVTDSKQGAGTIKIDGGTDVTVTASNAAAAGGVITVGQGGVATDLPSGAVAVTSKHVGTAATDVAMGAITISGGSTVSVTQTADASKAAADTTGATLTQGAVTVTAGNTTTGVTVTQAASQAEVISKAAVAGVTETASVKFSALTSGQTLILDLNNNGTVDAGDLQFKAAKDLTAAEVAQAFANLTNPDTQGSGIVANGVYTIAGTAASDFLATWTSGAASGDTVVFTSTTANTDVANLTFKGTGTAPVVTTTAGSAAQTAVTGKLGVITGAVTIDDNATASITTVTLDGYGATTIGNTATLSKLQTLSLANSGGATAGAKDAAVAVDAVGVATLALNLNNVQGAVNLDKAGDNALKTLNVTTSGANSTFALTAAAVETLTVAGDKAASFTADLDALKSVTVSGSAGLTLAAATANTITSINTVATTGAVTASIDGTKATYTGGAGKDVVTLLTGTALTKAIDLGAGDDTLIFGVGVTGSTAVLNGGDGIDTLSMTAANADALDAVKQTFYTGFERLTINNAAGTDDATATTTTLDLENLGFTNYVTTTGTVYGTGGNAGKDDALVLDKLANNGTVVLTAQGLVTVQIADAAAGKADVLNVEIHAGAVANGTADEVGILTAANVETVNIGVRDTLIQTPINAAPDTQNLTLVATSATKIVVTGDTALDLTNVGNTKVAEIDGSAMTAALTVTAAGTTATTIKGGSGNDVLTAATGTTADVLIGGAGNDTLIANAGLSVLTGGEGNDLFVIGTASANVNSYATITDFGAGDVLQLVGADSFASAAVTLGDTAVFQDYANAAINALGANDAGWFQFGGNTYVVVDIATGGTSVDGTTFDNGDDFIVKLTGLIDLSQASFNATTGTVALV